MSDFCEKCGCPFDRGDLRYNVKIESASMWDGYIEEPDGDVDEEIERLIQVLSTESPGKAARDVAHGLSLVLCPACRNKLFRDYDTSENATLH